MTLKTILFTLLALLVLAIDLNVECRPNFKPMRGLWRKTRQLFGNNHVYESPTQLPAAIVFQTSPISPDVPMMTWPAAVLTAPPMSYGSNLYPAAPVPTPVFGAPLPLTSFGSLSPFARYHLQPAQHLRYIRPSRSTPRNVPISSMVPSGTIPITTYYNPLNRNPVASESSEAYNKPSRFDEGPFKVILNDMHTELISPDSNVPSMYTSNAGGLSGSSSRSNSNADSLTTSPDSSILPVYVLPPKNFQPIVYASPTSGGGSIDRIDQAPTTYSSKGNPLAKTPEEYWYEESAGIIEHDEKKKSVEPLVQGVKTPTGYNKFNQLDSSELSSNSNNNNIGTSVAKVTSEPAPKIEYISAVEDNDDNEEIPLIEASSKNETRKEPRIVQDNPYSKTNLKSPSSYSFLFSTKAKRTNLVKPVVAMKRSTKETTTKHKEQTRNYKTKLPVGLTSFLLGGIRGVNGRHWEMPADLVKQLEFMPNISPITAEEKYHPELNEPKTTPSAVEEPIETSELVSTLDEGVGEQEAHSESDNKYEEGPKSNMPSTFNANAIIDSEIGQEAQGGRTSEIRDRPSSVTVATASIADQERKEKKL